MTFPEALSEAAHTLGLPLPQRTSEDTHTAALAAAAETAAILFTQWLWSEAGTPGRAYLQERGITEATARIFRVGFHPNHPTLLSTALAQHEVDPVLAQRLGLLRRKDTHWSGLLRGRLIFPICDRQGHVRGFGARTLDGAGPKYLNSPESPLFQKGHLLYGLSQATTAVREQQDALVVEGYLDVLTLHQAGLCHTVSPMATALTAAHLALVRQLTERVTLLFDGDAAGHGATVRALVPALEQSLSARVARLPRGEDPDSYVRRYGSAGLQERVATAIPLITYVLDALRAQGGTAKAVREAVVLAGRFGEPTAQLVFLQGAEQQFGLPAGSLLETAGIGMQARQHLEEILCGLLVTVPEVRARLRACTLPVRDPQLRALAESVLQGTPYTGTRIKLSSKC